MTRHDQSQYAKRVGGRQQVIIRHQNQWEQMEKCVKTFFGISEARSLPSSYLFGIFATFYLHDITPLISNVNKPPI